MHASMEVDINDLHTIQMASQHMKPYSFGIDLVPFQRQYQDISALIGALITSITHCTLAHFDDLLCFSKYQIR